MSKARPTSAGSRQAWGADYGGSARPDAQFDFGQEGIIRDDPDLSPTAMEDDYMNENPGKGKSSSAVPATNTKQSKSILSKIGGGIRSLWATRQTEDVKGDRELHVKTTLRELIVYIVFLVILCVVTFGMTTTTMYYYTKVMSDLFLDTTHSNGGGSFRTITSVEDFWKFAKGPLIKGLYWETWYNNQTVPDDQLGYIYYENKLLGVPRIRQLQVNSNSCVVHEDFRNAIRECYEAYSESLENKDPFGEKDNHTGWFFRTEDELDGSSHWGLLTTYSGAGYVEDLTRNKSESETVINYLFDKRWIVRGTRIVFIDFTVYNANINLFCVIRLTVEFPPTGGAIPHATLRTVKLIRYVTVTDYFIMACEFIFCLFIIYYMIEEGIEIKKHKFSYFKSFWNILDILVIAIAIVCVAFNVYRTLKVDELLSDLLNKPDQYADFEFLSYGQTQFDNAIAIAVFLAWIKIFKYISFNKTMTQLSSTLGKCAKDLAGFAVMFFIIFLAFTQLGYLLFGTQVKDFSNFQNSFFTLFRIILGDFDFEQLEQANRVLGPIFFMLFVFFVFFVLINMFLAIINDTYSEVKGDMANQKNEFEMTDYFKRGYEKMISKLNFKHDKIVDIQKALQSADMNNDKQLDFDEWRTDLKMRGYADCEIEALFARYDTDGDRVLDEDEQLKMQNDLAKQKDALSKQYDELDKIPRPESARRSNSKISFNDDSADDSDDEDSHTKSSRSGPSQSVSYEEFTVLSRRVDRMEHSIGSIVSKIDAVLVKLEAMEKAKLKRRETMGKILDSITESDGTSDEVKREQMERLVREELERWDSESSITPQASGRGPSPSSSGRGARSRSRPGSGNANIDKYLDLEDLIAESPPPPILVMSQEQLQESPNTGEEREESPVLTREETLEVEVDRAQERNLTKAQLAESETGSSHMFKSAPKARSITSPTASHKESECSSIQENAFLECVPLKQNIDTVEFSKNIAIQEKTDKSEDMKCNIENSQSKTVYQASKNVSKSTSLSPIAHELQSSSLSTDEIVDNLMTDNTVSTDIETSPMPAHTGNAIAISKSGTSKQSNFSSSTPVAKQESLFSTTDQDDNETHDNSICNMKRDDMCSRLDLLSPLLLSNDDSDSRSIDGGSVSKFRESPNSLNLPINYDSDWESVLSDNQSIDLPNLPVSPVEPLNTVRTFSADISPPLVSFTANVQLPPSDTSYIVSYSESHSSLSIDQPRLSSQYKASPVLNEVKAKAIDLPDMIENQIKENLSLTVPTATKQNSTNTSKNLHALTTSKGQHVSVGTLCQQAKTKQSSSASHNKNQADHIEKKIHVSGKTKVHETLSLQKLDPSESVAENVSQNITTNASSPGAPSGREKIRKRQHHAKNSKSENKSNMNTKPVIPPKPKCMANMTVISETKPELPPRKPIITSETNGNLNIKDTISVKPVSLAIASGVCNTSGDQNLVLPQSSSKNTVSALPSCKTPVMENLTPSVFV